MYSVLTQKAQGQLRFGEMIRWTFQVLADACLSTIHFITEAFPKALLSRCVCSQGASCLSTHV